MKEIFKFKQFDVNQRGCTMKINTDGVLLAVKALGGKSVPTAREKVEKNSDSDTYNDLTVQIKYTVNNESTSEIDTSEELTAQIESTEKADIALDSDRPSKIVPQNNKAETDGVLDTDISGETVPQVDKRVDTDGDNSSRIDSQTNDKVKIGRILDIGTGTGVIGLMLAQRFPEAQVEAIDIDGGAFNCAKLNFENSPFSGRLSIHHIGIEDFESTNHFDLIVSNPPFFINSLKNTNDRKTLSRHASIAFYEALFAKCHDLLTADGSFEIIWPLEIRDQILHVGISKKLYLSKEIHISSFPDSNPFRVISVFKKSTPDLYKSENFHIYKEQGVYSESYLELLRPFFIKIT